LPRRRALRARGAARVPAGNRPHAPDPRSPAAHPPSAGRRLGLPPRHEARAHFFPAGAARRGTQPRPSAHRPAADLARAAAEGQEAPGAATRSQSGTELIRPDWPAPPNVHAVMTTRNTVDAELRVLLPGEPAWLRQVHGTRVVRIDQAVSTPEADAVVTATKNRVCAIKAADCMPVVLVDENATVIGGAHAGWRGLCAGVIENTVEAMGVAGGRLLAWLGPAIGPKVYEVGDEVRDAFKEKDAFSPTRPGHWLLDLYAVARQRLQASGVERIFGAGYCTYSEPERFYSYRRDGTTGRMAALIWLSE